jgi:Domain of unknown function (DUF4602)
MSDSTKKRTRRGGRKRRNKTTTSTDDSIVSGSLESNSVKQKRKHASSATVAQRLSSSNTDSVAQPSPSKKPLIVATAPRTRGAGPTIIDATSTLSYIDKTVRSSTGSRVRSSSKRSTSSNHEAAAADTEARFLPSTAEVFAAAAAEIHELGGARLSKRARKFWEARRLKQLGVAPKKEPKRPYHVGMGMYRKEKERAKYREQKLAESGLHVSKKSKEKPRSRSIHKSDNPMKYTAIGREKRGVLMVSKGEIAAARRPKYVPSLARALNKR